jgi:hypothetical protein
MFVVTTILTKSDPSKSYWRIFRDDHDALMSACFAAGDLVSVSLKTTKDSRIITHVWKSDDAWLEYAEHPATIALSKERDAYAEQNGITKIIQTAEVSDVA